MTRRGPREARRRVRPAPPRLPADFRCVRAGVAQGLSHTVASGGSVSPMLDGRPWYGTGSGFSGSVLRMSPPP